MNQLARPITRRPDLTVAALLLLAAVIFFSGALWPPPGQALSGHDMVGYYYPAWNTVRQALRAGHIVTWEAEIFAGFPFLAQPQQNTFYPPNWINILLPLRAGVTLLMVFHVWLASLGMVIFTRRLGARRGPALLAGLGFAYGGLLTGRLWAGHAPVYAVFIWTPLLLAALHWAVARRSWAAAVLAGAPFGLAILAGHIPSFLYVGLIWAAFVAYLLLTRPGERRVVLRAALVSAAVGLALAAVQLVPFLQFSLASERLATADYAFATDYSLPPAHLITLLVPEFFGEPLRVGYWSVPTFEELTYYAGGLAVLGLLLALRRPTRLTWFYLALIVGGLWLALGRYSILYELAYRFLPPFRLVRAPGRAAFLYLFAASALLAHTLTVWRDMPAAERRRWLWPYWPAAVAVLAVALVAALAATGAVFMAIHPTDTSGRLWQQIGGYSQALAVIGLGGALLWAYLTRPDAPRPLTRAARLRRLVLPLALAVLVMADTWSYAHKMVRLAPIGPDPVWTDGLAVIGQPTGRVLPWGVPLFSQNGAVQVGWPSIFGYDSLEPAATITLAASVPDPRSTAYDILGATHVLAGGPLDDFTSGERPLTLVGQQGAAWVYARARPLPLSRLVYAVEVIADSGAAIARVHAADFDPATTAILPADPGCALGPAPAAGTAEVLAHEPTRWQIRTRSDAPALHVLAENAFPGWRVTIDGRSAAPLTAYTAIRAVCVPAGEHLIEWRFQPTLYWLGAALTLLALLALLACSRFQKKVPGGRKGPGSTGQRRTLFPWNLEAGTWPLLSRPQNLDCRLVGPPQRPLHSKHIRPLHAFRLHVTEIDIGRPSPGVHQRAATVITHVELRRAIAARRQPADKLLKSIDDHLVVPLRGRIDQVTNARRRRQLDQFRARARRRSRARRVVADGQTLVDEQPQHTLAGAVTHQRRDMRITGQEQLDGEVRQQTAIDNAVAGHRRAHIVAPFRLPDDLLPDERQTHGHPHPPDDRHQRRGAMIEHKHTPGRRIGGDQRQLAARRAVEVSESLPAQVARLPRRRRLVQLGPRPIDKGIGRIPAAALDKGKHVGKLRARHQIENDAVNIGLHIVRHAGQVDGLQHLARNTALDLRPRERPRLAQELLEHGHTVGVLLVQRVNHLRHGQARGRESRHNRPGRRAQQAAKRMPAPLHLLQRAHKHHPLRPAPLEHQIVLHLNPPFA